MNNKLVLHFLGTKPQDFFANAYNFGFLLLFYQLSGSLMISGGLTATTLVISRVFLFFMLPLFKGNSPILVSSVMSVVMGTAAIGAALTFSLWSGKLFCFFILSVLFSTISSLDQSFTNAIIPRIVERDYLYKANSLNGVFSNVVMLSAPLLGYFFNEHNFSALLVLYSVVCFSSAGVLYKLYRMSGEADTVQQARPAAKKVRYFSDEWVKTVKLITSNSDLLFCILIGIIINFIFSGINGPYILGGGDSAFESTLLKISIAVGSLVGVYGVFLLKVKEHYKKYIQVSLAGIVLTLILLANVSNLYITMTGIILLTMFVMFIMNSTGTFLQLATPLDELPSVYAFRTSIYAIVVPISYLAVGWMMEHYGSKMYFYVSVSEVLAVVILSRYSKLFALKGTIGKANM